MTVQTNSRLYMVVCCCAVFHFVAVLCYVYKQIGDYVWLCVGVFHCVAVLCYVYKQIVYYALL